MGVFMLDPDIVGAAALYEPSAEVVAGEVDADALRGAVAQMESGAKGDWLVRLARGGAGEAHALLGHLRALVQAPQEAVESPTFEALLESVESVRSERVRRETEAELR